MKNTSTESRELKEARKLLQKQGISPEHVVEYTISLETEETLKEEIRQATQGHCYFFSKKVESERIHLIAFINIENIADIFESIKASYSSVKENKLNAGTALENITFI